MNSEKLSRWLSVAANVGILAGLILVAIELNQTAELARAQFVNDGNNEANQIYASMLGEEPFAAMARSFECPEKMDFEDFVTVDTFLYTTMNNFYRNYLLSQEGLYSDKDWKTMIELYANWFLKHEFGRKWWENEGSQFFDKEFANYVDAQLEGEGLSMYEYWEKIRPNSADPNVPTAFISRACEI